MTEEKIKALLALRGMTQAEAARRLGISPQKFSRGIKTGSFRDYEKLAEILDAEYVEYFQTKEGTRI